MARNKRPKTAEEIRIQKRDCERRRRARIKADPELYEANKKKDNQRYLEKRRKKQVKIVSEMTPRERRAQQREWRERKARSRLNKKRNQQLIQNLRENTPDSIPDDRILHTPNLTPLSPLSPVLSHVSSSPRMSPVSLRSSSTVVSSAASSASNLSRQKLSGLNSARKRREKTHRAIKTQEHIIKSMEKKIHTLRVQLLRANHKLKKLTSPPKNVTNKQIITRKLKKMHSKVMEFLERDDNSKLAPGKKDVITKNKLKKQRRYLCDTLSNLHAKFLIESKEKISLSTFCRMRPFWFVSRQVTERDTCMCVMHENMSLMFDSLKFLGILKASNLTELCHSIVCTNYEACMLRKCPVCINKSPDIQCFDGSETTKYKIWCVTKEKRLIKGQEKEIRRTVKAQKIVTKIELVRSFLEELNKFLEHQFNINHQYAQTTSIKNNLADEDIFMQIDFSENYCCKYSNEIQSVHFGASRQQISLHTGVYYFKCPDTQSIISCSFCTFSENLRHDASAICAHLEEILDMITASRSIKTLHILSDGPSAQYKNRYMIYLFTQYLARKYNLKCATWNFCEAGHGKGPMDGVGAVIKRTADRIVAQGLDIPDFDTLLDCINKNTNNIITSTVTTAQIEKCNSLLSKSISSVPGITKVHQITWDSHTTRKVFMRKLTCLICTPGQVCPHYSLPKKFVEFVIIHEEQASETEEQGHDSETEEQGQDSETEEQGQDTETEEQGQASETEEQGQESETEEQGQDSETEEQGQDSETEEQGQDSETEEQGQDSETEEQGQDTETEERGQDTENEEQEQSYEPKKKREQNKYINKTKQKELVIDDDFDDIDNLSIF